MAHQTPMPDSDVILEKHVYAPNARVHGIFQIIETHPQGVPASIIWIALTPINNHRPLAFLKIRYDPALLPFIDTMNERYQRGDFSKHKGKMKAKQLIDLLDQAFSGKRPLMLRTPPKSPKGA